MTLAADLAWSRRWIPNFKKFIGPELLREGTLQEDWTEATDLITLRAPGMRIGCRVRKPKYQIYAGDLTITTRRDNGLECEWHKMILGGWGDWFCYAIATTMDPRFGTLVPITLIDLARARPVLKRWIPVREYHNGDPVGERCWFRVWSIAELIRKAGPDVIVARRYPIPPRQCPRCERVTVVITQCSLCGFREDAS